MTESPLHALASAADSDDVIDALLRDRAQGASVYVVDHAVDRLARVGGTSSADGLRLEGELRHAILGGTQVTIEESTWTPILERGQTVFVINEPSSSASETDDDPALGLVLRDQRRRFESLSRARRCREMSVEAELQWDLLPVRADRLGGLDVASVLEPAYDVAGDLFDYALVDDTMLAYSLDGMGHGLDATMTGVLALAAIRNARRDGADIVEQMAAASTLLALQYGGDRFVTGAAVAVNADGSTTIVNAGHEPIRAVIAGRVAPLDLLAQLPLGVSPDETYVLQTGPSLGAGDSMWMLSDGPAGARAADGTSFGSAAVDRSIGQHSSSPLWCGVHAVMSDVLDFIGDGDVTDDMTMVAIQRRAGSDD